MFVPFIRGAANLLEERKSVCGGRFLTLTFREVKVLNSELASVCAAVMAHRRQQVAETRRRSSTKETCPAPVPAAFIAVSVVPKLCDASKSGRQSPRCLHRQPCACYPLRERRVVQIASAGYCIKSRVCLFRNARQLFVTAVGAQCKPPTLCR